MALDIKNVTNFATGAGAATTTTAPVNAYPVHSPSSGTYTVTNQLKGYNPKRYSGKILRKFYENCVLTQISNTDYEGEIKAYGDTVIIRKTPDIVVEDYKKGQELTYRVYDTDTVELTIDKGKYWAFVTNPIDIAQTDIKSFTEKWTSEASLRTKIAIEKDAFTYLLAQESEIVAGKNAGDTAGKLSENYKLGTSTQGRAIDNTNIVSAIVDCGSVLAEQDIPVDTEQCWMVVDQKFANLLANSELKAAMIAGDGKAMILKGGMQHNVPKLDCFDIYKSNVLPQAFTASTNMDGVVLFGHKDALTFASQITENEVIPNPHGFGKLHRGLMVYGFKLVQPKCFGILRVKYGAVVNAVVTKSLDD